jgi:CubicO group peptidase (beta-lactamase class C family)
MQRLTLIYWLAAVWASPGGLAAQQRHDLTAFVDSAAAATLRSGPVAGMSILVARGSTVLIDTAYGSADLENGVAATARTVYGIGSVSKQFTAAAIMRLAEEGKLRLDDDVAPFFPQFPFGARHVTIRELLMHTSGVHNLISPPTRDTVLRLPLPRDSALTQAYTAPFDYDPGARFQYSNTGYVMLGMIVEHITGRSYGDYLQQTFFTPLGLTSTHVCTDAPIVPHRARGYEVHDEHLVTATPYDLRAMTPAGGLCSTTHDLLAWSRALASGRAISTASYRQMATQGRLSDGTPVPNYGFALVLTTLGAHRSVWHDGGVPGFRARVATFPDDSLVVIVLANTIEPVGTRSPPAGLEVAIDRFVLGVPDIEGMMRQTIAAASIDSAIHVYRALRRRYPAPDFEAGQLNTIAYEVLRARKVDDAIRLFRLNVEMFPEDWNAYDSLGEGYMTHGDRALAIANYQHSVALNPKNDNATQMLTKLQAAAP